MVAAGSRSRRRAKMLRTTSAEWTPSLSAWAQAASTSGMPSVSTAARILTICHAAVVRACKLAPDPLQGAREDPVPERRAVAQRARLARQNGHVMPGIIDRPAATEGALMLRDNPAVLADHDSVGVGVNLDWAS